ncbi:MAG: sulfite exporter TauE/SafE family protein [Candidatus Omnitrophica bacterium]|nr:sulfite exporter TauE/SafE family protein [Candidatus Omnitrophota bacterium]MCM8768158.1 sulfite exporter TauE/SafE family protein [Candidatus Omnitrophota bacterium]
MQPGKIFFLVLIASLSALVQSFSGFGGGLLAIPLYTLFISPRLAVPINFLLMFLLFPGLIWESRRHLNWKLSLNFLVPALLTFPLGALCLAYLPVKTLRVSISVATLLFAGLFLFEVKLPVADWPGLRLLVGLISGFLGGSISQSGPPLVIYGLSSGWGKDTFRATLLLYFFLLTLTGTVSFLSLNLFSSEACQVVIIAALPAIASSALGIHLKRLAREGIFRRVILMVVILVSLLNLLSLLTRKTL